MESRFWTLSKEAWRLPVRPLSPTAASATSPACRRFPFSSIRLRVQLISRRLDQFHQLLHPTPLLTPSAPNQPPPKPAPDSHFISSLPAVCTARLGSALLPRFFWVSLGFFCLLLSVSPCLYLEDSQANSLFSLWPLIVLLFVAGVPHRLPLFLLSFLLDGLGGPSTPTSGYPYIDRCRWIY